VGKDIEWKDLDFDISDIGALTGSISEDARNTIGYLMDMVIAGDINEDMFYSLICAMTGFGDIPTDFVDEHYTDPEYMRLVELYSAAVKKQLKIQELRKSGDPVLSSKLENAMFEARSKDLEFVKARFEELSKVADVSQLTKITGYIDHLNTFFTYVNSGDTFSGAMAKSIGTGVYLKAVDSFAPLPIKVFEVVVATLFGKSKAGDAGSIVGTGKHSIEFFTDLVYVSMYDAWLNMDQFPDARKWDAFYTLWGMNVEQVLKDLMNSSTTKYGQNLTNMAILVDMAIDPDDLKYVFTGYADRFAEGKVWNDYCKDTYETTVVGNEFGTLLYDFVVKYYSSSPDVLTDKAKYKDQIRKKTGTTK